MSFPKLGFAIVLFCFSHSAFAYVSYRDKKGTLHYVNSKSDIPEQFRKVKTKSAAPQPPPPETASTKPQVVGTDIDGEIRAMAYMIKGSAYFDEQNFAKAQAFYEKALAANEKSAEIKGEGLSTLYSHLADTYFFQNKFQDSIKWMNKALESGMLNLKMKAHNQFNLACAYHELGNLKESGLYLRLTLITSKTSPELLAKYLSSSRTDKQLTKLRALPEFEQIMKSSTPAR